MLWSEISLGITALSFAVWLGLLKFRGQFWRCDQRLENQHLELETFPFICAVIPARNEAELLPIALRSLLKQAYPGAFKIVLVDDQSSDGTAQVAERVAEVLNKSEQLHILSAQPLPPGWTGKLWALEQGIQYAKTLSPSLDYFLLTDADIEHRENTLRQLVSKAKQENLDLVSVMVKLRCESFWEQFLIPAFVFFFQKLYPFRWVNAPEKSTAAAAGGCILITRDALKRIGSLESVRNALIDDCALAQVVKATGLPNGKGRIWLGLSQHSQSLRPYTSLETIWEMVARTAYTQLNYSFWLLLGTVFAMTLVYEVPVLAVLVGGLAGNGWIAVLGLTTWGLMSWAYLPTVRFYGLSPLWALSLSAIALLYTLMTVDSAWRHWQGRGGAWKGRTYQP